MEKHMKLNLWVLMVTFILLIPMTGCLKLSPTLSDGAPPEVISNEDSWPLANHDYSNTRTASHSSISSETISTLHPVWNYTIKGEEAFGAAISNPLILNDTVYFQDGHANTVALWLNNGTVQWFYESNGSLVLGPNGPAIGWGKVFVAKDVYTMVALELSSGRELWSTTLSHVATTGIDIQPTVYDNKVYVSTVPGIGDIYYAPGGIGVIYALDQATGDVIWNFSTVDSPDLWGHPEINSGGGCWYTPAIDLNTGLMFWGTGNPAPFPGRPGYPNGESRPGPNLYTNSLLALHSDTGVLAWYTQVVPHDLFDYDFQIPPILANATISGVEQSLVIGAGKNGRVYAFNRSSGSILWEAVVGIHQNDQLASLPAGYTTVLPGTLGGVETPMAYADGVIYTTYNNLYVNWTSVSYFAGNITPYIPPYNQATSGLIAIQASTGKFLWEQHFDVANVGGATVVNDLVFTATINGTIFAFNRSSGELLWSYQTPAGITAWPAVTGDFLVWPAGGGFGFSGTPTLTAFRIHPS
jgi:outer membrane protein assembly factor BamB